MPSEIKEKFGAKTALTITVAGLVSSVSYVGRQSDIVDNTVNRFGKILIFYRIKQGTSPTSARAAYFFLIRDDGTGTPTRTDAAGASDAAWTAITARQVHAAPNKPSGAATGDVIQGSFVFSDPGPKWALGISHDTGVNLDATGGNHEIAYLGVDPEAQ
jgi:hypothetical protein